MLFGGLYMSSKKNKSLIALCTVAIGSIYTAGYIHTSDLANPTSTNTTSNTPKSSVQAGSVVSRHHHNFSPSNSEKSSGVGSTMGQSTTTQNNQSIQTTQTNQLTQNTQSSQTKQTNQLIQNTQSSQTKQTNQLTQNTQSTQSTSSPTYKDGTYNGEAFNRIGSVAVAVTFKSNKITNVEITNCNTHYPESDIADLPNQVIQNQSSKIDTVSGATLSSEDFMNAVAQAISQSLKA